MRLNVSKKGCFKQDYVSDPCRTEKEARNCATEKCWKDMQLHNLVLQAQTNSEKKQLAFVSQKRAKTLRPERKSAVEAWRTWKRALGASAFYLWFNFGFFFLDLYLLIPIMSITSLGSWKLPRDRKKSKLQGNHDFHWVHFPRVLLQVRGFSDQCRAIRTGSMNIWGFIMENPIKMDALEVPPCQETSICLLMGCKHMGVWLWLVSFLPTCVYFTSLAISEAPFILLLTFVSHSLKVAR